MQSNSMKEESAIVDSVVRKLLKSYDNTVKLDAFRDFFQTLKRISPEMAVLIQVLESKGGVRFNDLCRETEQISKPARAKVRKLLLRWKAEGLIKQHSENKLYYVDKRLTFLNKLLNS